MPKLSAVIITKNEEDGIKECLEALNYFVDEIVVVDDESSDKTRDICKAYGAKVVVNKSEGNFDRQRNIGIDNATGEWILQMDADEIVSQAAAKKIIETLENPGKYVAFEIRRKNFFFNHPLEYVGLPDIYKVKIFKKEMARYVGRSVHETLKIEGKTGKIDAEVSHYPYTSLTKTLDKINFYSDVLAKNFVEDNADISWCEIKYRLVWKFIKHFWKLYVRKRGFRGGTYGFIWCVLNTIEPQIRWLKIWELAVKNNKLKKLTNEDSSNLQ